MTTIYSNSSTSTIDWVSYYIYVGEGFLLMILNWPLALIIFLTPYLRAQKEFIIFACCMIFDGIFGFAYFYCGIFRLIVYYTEEFIPMWSGWLCFNTPFNYGFIFITPGAGLLSLAVAVDRLISVALPTKYIKLPPTYAYAIVATAIVGSMPTFVISAIQCYERREIYEFPIICNIQNGTMPFLFYSLRGIRIIAIILAALLYVPIGLRIYLLNQSTANLAAFNNKNRKKLLRMTITIVLITTSQLVLFGFPDIWIFLNTNKSSPAIFFIMNLNKGVLNIVIFLITQRELRNSVFSRLRKVFWKKNTNTQVTLFERRRNSSFETQKSTMETGNIAFITR